MSQTENGQSSNPSQQQLSSLLGHYQNDRFGEAERLALSMTNEYPKYPFGWKVLSAILKQTGRVTESLSACQKVVELSPEDAEAHSNFGVTLQELGRLDEAETRYRKALKFNSNYVQAHYNLGAILQELGRLDEAETSYRQAIELKDDYVEAHNNLGNLFKEIGRLDEAVASYTKAISLKPDFAEVHNNLGNTLKQLGRLDEAETSYNQALSFKPDYAEAHNNLGVTLQELGRLEEAEASYKQAISFKPDLVEAHRILALLKKFDRQDEQFSKMQELYFDKNISEEQRCHINFGLAKAYEDLGDFEQAYNHYGEGNMLRKKLLNYSINKDKELFRQIKTNYPRIENNSLKPNKLSKKLIPIFIVGMPRSGTTLVEQIISSHSQVTGAGELNFAAKFGRAIATGFTEATNKSLLDFRHKYLNKLQSVSRGNLVVTDKMPLNFLYIGLLAAAFPEAKIIHVKRNPAAVCWSNYKQYFKAKNIGYCYALDDVISYYKLYENLIDFWTKMVSNRIYKLDYELLIVNQDSETRRIIQYLGLNWDEKCLSPQNNKRRVATASNLQITKKCIEVVLSNGRNINHFLMGYLMNCCCNEL